MKKIIIILTIITITVFSIGISNAFVSTGESREALVAQTMFIRGDLLDSIRYNNDLATKPPLFHWGILLISKIYGKVTEATSRIPSVLSATITMLVWFIFIYKKIGKEKAILTFFILLTAPEWYRHSSLARIDMTLTMFTTLSSILLFNWLKHDKKIYLFTSIIFLSLGVLTKGPIGVIIPMGIAFCSSFYLKNFSTNNIFYMIFISCLSLIAWVCWFFFQIHDESRNFLNIAFTENFGRFFDNIESGKDPHATNIFYFLLTFIVGCIPWSLFFLINIKKIFTLKFSFIKDNDEKQFLGWCIISILFCLVFFMIPEGKRGVYLLPIYPMMATVIATFLYQIENTFPQLIKKIVFPFSCLLVFSWGIVFLLKFNLINTSFLSSIHEGQKILFYTSLINAESLNIFNGIYTLFPIIATVLILFLFKEYKNYFLRFSLILILFFSFTKLILLNPATKKISSEHFVHDTLYNLNISDLTVLESRMYPTIFYIRNLKPDINILDFNKDNYQLPKYIYLWQNDEDLFKKIDNYKIKKSEYQVEKFNRFLEFGVLKKGK